MSHSAHQICGRVSPQPSDRALNGGEAQNFRSHGLVGALIERVGLRPDAIGQPFGESLGRASPVGADRPPVAVPSGQRRGRTDARRGYPFSPPHGSRPGPGCYAGHGGEAPRASTGIGGAIFKVGIGCRAHRSGRDAASFEQATCVRLAFWRSISENAPRPGSLSLAGVAGCPPEPGRRGVPIRCEDKVR